MPKNFVKFNSRRMPPHMVFSLCFGNLGPRVVFAPFMGSRSLCIRFILFGQNSEEFRFLSDAISLAKSSPDSVCSSVSATMFPSLARIYIYIFLKCYYDQKYEFVVLSIFRKYKYILLTVQSFKSKFVREVQLF